MNDKKLIALATSIAIGAHNGQVDKAGVPYITHVIRVMGKMTSINEIIAALLHDVVEDGGVTFSDLSAAGIPDVVVAAVNALTHKKSEPYADYIERAGDNAIAKAVKIADLEDNMNVSRLPEITPDDVARLSKYIRAYKYLKSIA